MSSLSIGIIYKHHHAPAKAEAKKLQSWLKNRGIETFCEEMSVKEPFHVTCTEELSVIPKSVDGVIVLGGDGTLLGVARAIGRHGIPILGVNLGGLGFLTEVPIERLYFVLEMLIEGKIEAETRVMLEAKVLRNDQEVCRFQVLNDIVANKRTLARIIDLDVTINDEFLTTYRSDGLIISTPTGSTAYNLSAGGPILYPTMETFILTPICPFTLTNRPLIVPDTDIIKIKIGKRTEERAVLTFDGQMGFDFNPRDELVIYKAKDKIKLLTPHDSSFFKILRKKLMWGGATYNQKHGDQ